MKTFFKKLEYSFSVKSTKIENAILLYKTALSEPNVKTNRKDSTKCKYYKERRFTSIYLIFSKILFQYKILLERVDLMYQLSKCPYS